VTRQEFILRAVIVAVITALTISLMLLVEQIYPILLLAFSCWVLATALNMVVDRFEANGVNRNLAIGLTITLVVVLSSLFLMLVVPSFVEEGSTLVDDLPDTARSALDNYSEFRENSGLAQQVLPAVQSEDLENTIDRLVDDGTADDGNGPLNLERMLGTATTTLVSVGRSFGQAVVTILLLLLLTIFLMINPIMFEQMLVALVPEKAEARTVEVLNQVRLTVREWVGAMAISVSVTGLLYWVVLGLILGLPNAIVLSVIGGIATIVPTIGPTIAIIPVIVLSLAEGATTLLWAVLLYSAVGIVQDRVINPAVMKRELDIPAAGLVIFQLIAASLLGFIGVVIAVPLLAVLITLTREVFVEDILGKKQGAPEVTAEGGKVVFPSTEQIDDTTK
jgi:predicted PurR-regulated permease PerM